MDRSGIPALIEFMSLHMSTEEIVNGFDSKTLSAMRTRPKLFNRMRYFPQENYFALFVDGATSRFRLVDKEIEPLEYPEFYDIAINNKCHGRCSYCYIEAVSTGINYPDVCWKAILYFGAMDLNQRPFQVAIGGAGEPTLHPELPDFLATLHSLQIVPNYTTNGMHLSQKVIDATIQYAGGVAVTAHQHLKWERAVDKLLEAGVDVNIHLIPMSSDMSEMRRIVNKYRGRVSNFVMLPYQAVGFAAPIDTSTINNAIFSFVESLDVMSDIVWGAYFYDELVKRPQYNLSLYKEGVFGKYIDMNGSMSIYKSSFDWKNPIKVGLI